MRYAGEIRRGALANAVGLVAKGAMPLSYWVLTRLFGSELFGEYLLAFFIANVLSSAFGTGFMNAVTVFAAPPAGEGDREAELRVVASALRASAALAVGFAVLVVLGAGPFCDAVYPHHEGLATGLVLLSFGVVPEMITRVAVGLGKAHLEMRWDPIVLGLTTPVLQILFGLGAWALDLGLTGLFGATLLAQAVTALAALPLLRRFLPIRGLMGALFRRGGAVPGLLSFGLIQGLNMGVTRYASRVDVIMLGAMGLPAWQLGWYATAAMFTSELRQFRIVFAEIATPIVARAKKAGETANLNALLRTVSRRATLMIVPAVALTTAILGTVLGWFDGHYGDAPFLLALLVTPALSCAYGFSGNFLVASGHSHMNLMNATVAAGVNTGLNALLIPDHGLLGAAVATATAQAVQVAMENAELWRLERVRLDVIGLLLPAALLAPVFVVLAMNATSEGLTVRALVAAAAGLGSLLIYTATRQRPLVRNEDTR